MGCIKYQENIEKIFKDEVREKKRIGTGVFSRRGKGVKHGISGALKTPYHYMSNKEKKLLNGKVEIFNMYETIIPYNEFELKDLDAQKTLLIRWRELYNNKKIKEDMKLTNSQYYELVAKLELPPKVRTAQATSRSNRTKEKSTAITVAPTISSSLELEIPKEIMEIKEPIKQTLITKGLHLEYNGDYDVETLNKLFTKLQLLIDGESNKYHISLSLDEIVED